jgi:hypothetical protein
MNHMFAIVTDDKTGKVVKQYSYGPSTSVGGHLVAQGEGTAIHSTDRAFFETYSKNAAAAKEQGISATTINASDKSVIASGEAVNSVLGTKDKPGDMGYALVPNALSDSSAGNSNSAAYAVADGAVKSENPNAEQKLPPGTQNPGWGQSDHVTSRVDCATKMQCK